MAVTIQFRRDTGAAWTSEDPVLALGELGLETDTLRYKIGDGASSWTELAYRELAPEVTVLAMAAQSENPDPPASGLLLWDRPIAGRQMPRWMGPAGVDVAAQPALFGNGMYMVAPGTTTAMNVWGGPALTAVGTVSHPTLAATNARTQTSRAQVLSAATANSAAELRAAFARVWRGDQAGLGGFFLRMRFAINTTTLLQRGFFGLTSSTGATSTTQSPPALTSCIGVGWDSDDANLVLMHNDASGACTEVPLGVDLALDTAAVYDLTLFAAPNSDRIAWAVARIDTGAEVTGEATTDLPPSTTFLAPHAYMNNGGTAAAVGLDLARLYIETDY